MADQSSSAVAVNESTDHSTDYSTESFIVEYCFICGTQYFVFASLSVIPHNEQICSKCYRMRINTNINNDISINNNNDQ